MIELTGLRSRRERIRPISDKETAGNAPENSKSKLNDALGGNACLFCGEERSLKPNCTKQRWKVCNSHFMVTCPICGHEAFWMEGMKSGDYYACFSLSCNWTDRVPPNENEITGVLPEKENQMQGQENGKSQAEIQNTGNTSAFIEPLGVMEPLNDKSDRENWLDSWVRCSCGCRRKVKNCERYVETESWEMPWIKYEVCVCPKCGNDMEESP